MSLSNKGAFKVGSYEFTPKSLKVDFESLASDNSGRTLDGVMHIYWVFNRIRKLEIEMAPMSASELTTLLSLVQGQEYEITYFDPLANAERTTTVYTSTSSADVYSGVIRNGLYQGVSFNAIELEGESSVSIVPTLATTGNLIIATMNTDATFAKSGNNLLVEDDTATYAITNNDLYREAN